MSVQPSPPPENNGSASFLPATRLLFHLLLFLSLFGQPHGLFLYFPPFPMLLLALLVVFAGILLIDKLRHHPFTLPRTNINRAVVLFFGLSLASLAYSPEPVLGARLLFSMLTKVILFFAIADLVSQPAELRALLKTLTWIGVAFATQALCLVVAVMFFHVQPAADFNRTASLGDSALDFKVTSYGLLGLTKQTYSIGSALFPRCQAMFLEPGYFANFLELTLFATLGYIALSPRQPRWRTGLWLGVQIVALLLSFSTAGFLSCGIGLLVYLVFKLRGNLKRLLQGLVVAGVALLVLSGILAMMFPETANQVYQVVLIAKFVSDDSTLTSAEDRSNQLSRGVQLFTERPLTGWGSGQTRVVTDGFIANNALVTAAAELGIVGLGIYLAILGGIALTMILDFRMARRVEFRAPMVLTGACAGAVTAMTVHTLFIETQWSFYYWIGIGLLYVNHRLLRRQRLLALAAE